MKYKLGGLIFQIGLFPFLKKSKSIIVENFQKDSKKAMATMCRAVQR